MSTQHLSALVSSRICHDLISPLGAIGNGVELIAMTGGPASPEIDLIGDSVNSATAKLRFFRIAFGAAPDGAQIRGSELRDAAAAMFGGRHTLTIDCDLADVSRLTAKSLFMALLCIDRCLPLGGESAVTVTGAVIRIDTRAGKVRDAAEAWALLDTPDGSEDVLPADVQFPLLGALVAERGLKLTRQSQDGASCVTISGFKP